LNSIISVAGDDCKIKDCVLNIESNITGNLAIVDSLYGGLLIENTIFSSDSTNVSNIVAIRIQDPADGDAHSIITKNKFLIQGDNEVIGINLIGNYNSITDNYFACGGEGSNSYQILLDSENNSIINNTFGLDDQVTYSSPQFALEVFATNNMITNNNFSEIVSLGGYKVTTDGITADISAPYNSTAINCGAMGSGVYGFNIG
jgi:hypothetical protein